MARVHPAVIGKLRGGSPATRRRGWTKPISRLPSLTRTRTRLPTPDSRFPIPDSRFPIPDSRFPIPGT